MLRGLHISMEAFHIQMVTFHIHNYSLEAVQLLVPCEIKQGGLQNGGNTGF